MRSRGDFEWLVALLRSQPAEGRTLSLVCAVRTAEAAGMTLAAVARGDAFEVLTHAERVSAAKAPGHADLTQEQIEQLIAFLNTLE